MNGMEEKQPQVERGSWRRGVCVCVVEAGRTGRGGLGRIWAADMCLVM